MNIQQPDSQKTRGTSVNQTSGSPLPEHVYAKGHLPGAIDIRHHLHQLGYHNVHRYTAGKQDWITAGLPIEHNAPPGCH